jgi:hypothetical protein
VGRSNPARSELPDAQAELRPSGAPSTYISFAAASDEERMRICDSEFFFRLLNALVNEGKVRFTTLLGLASFSHFCCLG